MFRRLPSLFTALSLLSLPVVASAGVPDATWSTWPHHVALVGRNAIGTSDPTGTLDFHITRFGGTAEVGGATIILDLTNAPDLGVCLQQDSGVEVLCNPGGQRLVRVICDAHGRASFRVCGHANHLAAGTNAPSLAVYADGVPFGTIPIAAYDQDGNGLGPADNSLWQADYFSNQYWQRSDLDGDGVLGPADLSLWLDAFFADGSLTNCVATACP